MYTETFLAYAEIKGSPGTGRGYPEETGLNLCCGAGLGLSGELGIKGMLRKASPRR